MPRKKGSVNKEVKEVVDLEIKEVEEVGKSSSKRFFEGKEIKDILGEKIVGGNKFLIGRAADGATYDIPVEKE